MKKLLSCCTLLLLLTLSAPRTTLAQGPAALNHIALYVT